jgi:hypothetical protein
LLLGGPVCGIVRYFDVTIDAHLDIAVTEHSLGHCDSGNAQCRPYPGAAVASAISQKIDPRSQDKSQFRPRKLFSDRTLLKFTNLRRITPWITSLSQCWGIE